MLESDLSGALQREFALIDGKRISRRDISSGNYYFYLGDHLDSSRVVTNSAGVIQNESDYYPYGGERLYSQALGSQNYKFTSKERDSESGLDDFGARHYASVLGRFVQTDPKAASAHVLNPQSWNRYVYTQNNPLKFLDPDGMDVVLAAGLSTKDRAYVVNNLARMYATPAGRGFLERADKSQFTITVGTGHLGRTDLTKAPPGTIVFGGQTHVEGGNT